LSLRGDRNCKAQGRGGKGTGELLEKQPRKVWFVENNKTREAQPGKGGRKE